jgi:hypothetical protein
MPAPDTTPRPRMLDDARPYTRWWWFCAPIQPEVIRAQLEWARDNGFGGVEIAWLYGQAGAPPGPAWLSPEWAAPVAFAKQAADEIGLGCDFTVGSAWPFGGPDVPAEDASLTYAGRSAQRLEKAWGVPLGAEGGYILNHLDRQALGRYLDRFGAALGGALAGGRASALFCDSWEVVPEGLWSRGFDAAFQARHGYDVLPLMPDLDAHPDARYDYRKLLSQAALDEFYRPYAQRCHALGAAARVQCHGAPADLLAAYALADVPESEALLFDCDFAAFAASAAAVAGRPVVSAESFTCLYGWVACPGPGPHQGREQLGDLKLIADGLFANGVNAIVWHGMPYNPPGGSNRFYATTHVGPDCAFAGQLRPFNAYLEQVSAALRRGRTYADVAVYLPLEDAWMQGELPAALQKPSSKYVYELQETKFPAWLRGRHPLWVSGAFLRDAVYDGQRLRCGAAEFRALVVDVEWLDGDALADLLRLARAGLPVCLRRLPRQPGRNRNIGYQRQVAELAALPNVSDDARRVLAWPALAKGDDLPEFWCREEDDRLTFFFAHPASRGLRYPMAYGGSAAAGRAERRATLHAFGDAREVALSFAPRQSILLSLTRDGGVVREDVQYVTPEPRAT